MHSIAIASIMVAAATLTTAAPAHQRREVKFYRCGNNGFQAECSVDPCAMEWCPDYKPGTYERVQPAACVPPVDTGKPVSSETGTKPETTTPETAPGYYSCPSNGFKGYCTVNPCGLPWCPDGPNGAEDPNKKKPEEPAKTPEEPAKVPEEPVKTPKEPVDVPPTVPETKKEMYNCASNGFVGLCSVKACDLAWCPDYEPKTYKPIAAAPAQAKRTDLGVCAPGTGYYQDCGNGFKGCCKSDACGSKTKWCPDYKPWTFEPVSATPETETVSTPPKTETVATTSKTETVPPVSQPADYCAPGTGYYQKCGNGFRGCCKADACTLGFCPTGTVY